jgi:hypothetical protein
MLRHPFELKFAKSLGLDATLVLRTHGFLMKHERVMATCIAVLQRMRSVEERCAVRSRDRLQRSTIPEPLRTRDLRASEREMPMRGKEGKGLRELMMPAALPCLV